MTVIRKISIVEDNADLREALSLMIQFTEGFELVNCYENAEIALQKIPDELPDALLVDINLPQSSGIEMVLHLKQQFPEVLFLMCTSYDDDDKIFSSLEAGANGYILKSEGPGKIIEALKDLFEGGSPMTGSIARKVVASFSKVNTSNQNTLALTKREIEILNFLSKGMLNKEVANEMNISTGTVKKHVQNIYEKLHVNTRVEAVNKYLKR